MKKVAFLFSGRGSLLPAVMKAISDCKQEAELSLVITNNATFTPTGNTAFDKTSVTVIDHRDFSDRNGFEHYISELLESYNIGLIILGGFRRIFSHEFVNKFGNITMNTHPSLLPSFPGDRAQLKAIKGGYVSPEQPYILLMKKLMLALSLIKSL